MENNEKIAFGMLAAIVVVQAVKFRVFRKNVVDFANHTATFANSIVQQQVDEEFNRIIEDYDRP